MSTFKTRTSKNRKKQCDLDKVLRAAVLLWPEEEKNEEEEAELKAVISIQCTLRQHQAARQCLKKIRERREDREEAKLTKMYEAHDQDQNGIME